MKDPHRYDNMIDFERPKAPRPMDKLTRAAQFSPFAALTGYGDVVKETARLTDRHIELSEEEIAQIDSKLNYINEHISECPAVRVTYYIPDKLLHKDSKKEGGKYETYVGTVKKIDMYTQQLVFEDLTRIDISSIHEICI